MASAIVWMLVYVIVAQKLKLQCPHCQARSVGGAGKTFVFGPLFRLRCSECTQKSRSSFLLLPWNIVFAIGFLVILVNGGVKAHSRFIDIPSIILTPAFLAFDMFVRFYVFKLKRA